MNTTPDLLLPPANLASALLASFQVNNQLSSVVQGGMGEGLPIVEGMLQQIEPPPSLFGGFPSAIGPNWLATLQDIQTMSTALTTSEIPTINSALSQLPTYAATFNENYATIGVQASAFREWALNTPAKDNFRADMNTLYTQANGIATQLQSGLTALTDTQSKLPVQIAALQKIATSLASLASGELKKLDPNSAIVTQLENAEQQAKSGNTDVLENLVLPPILSIAIDLEGGNHQLSLSERNSIIKVYQIFSVAMGETLKLCTTMKNSEPTFAEAIQYLTLCVDAWNKVGNNLSILSQANELEPTGNWLLTNMTQLNAAWQEAEASFAAVIVNR